MFINNHKNIAFASKIEFVKRDEFDKRIMRSREVAKDYNFDIKSSLIGENLHTEYASVCVAGGFHNKSKNLFKKKKVFMYHLRPGPENLDEFDKTDENNEIKKRFIRAKKELGKNLNGLIIGGKCNAKESEEIFEKSEQLYKELIKLYSSDDLKINFSYLCGKNRRSSPDSVHYSVDTDTWSICNEEIRGNIEEVKNLYRDIYISPNDDLWIHGQEISRQEHPELFAKLKL